MQALAVWRKRAVFYQAQRPLVINTKDSVVYARQVPLLPGRYNSLSPMALAEMLSSVSPGISQAVV